MRDVIAWIDTRLTDSVRLSEVSRYAGCSEFHLSRVFREHVGLPVIAYVRKRSKVLAAHDLCGDARISDIDLFVCGGTRPGIEILRRIRRLLRRRKLYKSGLSDFLYERWFNSLARSNIAHHWQLDLDRSEDLVAHPYVMDTVPAV